MGIGDFFKNLFGKKTCAFCGGECGAMSRTKIKGDEYICNKCDDKCSLFIRKGRFTKEELERHMEYMERSDRIFKEVIDGNNSKLNCYPLPVKVQGIEFYDDFGMFRIRDASRDRKPEYPKELFRYDQVESYKPYLEEKRPSEEGKPMEFEECGIELTFVGGMNHQSDIKQGSRRHPYIIEPIRVCFTKRAEEKESMLKYAENVIAHFDYIFGVHSDRTALFSFGMSKQDKRELQAGIAAFNTFATAVKVAKEGEGALTEEKAAEIKENMDKIADATTRGLAVYTRLADEAEAKIK